MDRPTRPPNRSDGLTAVAASEESGGEPPTVSAAEAPTRTSRTDCGGHPEPGGGGETEPPYRTSALQTRSIIHVTRRYSSGYFSSDGDSLPSSPLTPTPVTVEKATQTPSPTGQVMNHALQRAAEVQSRGVSAQQQQHGGQLSPASAQQQRHAAEDMTAAAAAVGRELRRVGDEFNDHLLDVAGRHRWAGIQPVQVPRIHQEPAVLLCVGLLLLVTGLIIYLRGSTDIQGRSRV